MKKIFTSLLFFSFVWLVDAQFKVVQPLNSERAIFNKVPKTGFEPATGIVNPGGTHSKLNKRYPADRSGITTYDLQSNGPIPNHLAIDGNGNLVTAWTMSFLADGAWGDRGSGYNKFTAGAWDAEPMNRVEAVRTGWGNIAVDAEGTEIIVSHPGDYKLNVARKKVGGSWVNTKIPSSTPKGVLWPRAAIGGVDNKTLHVIAVTLPTDGTFGGVIYRGVNGHILYYRSPDGGVTWDIKDMILPGLDSVDFAKMDSDSYSLYAKGNTVAILLQTQWNDMSVFKSTDNGTTWTKTIIRKFPLKRYIYDTEYSLDDIGGVDTAGPGGSATADDAAMKSIYTNDGSGNLVIDNNGKVHAFWGEMYVTDVTPGDAQSSYYPGRNGIDYWNEDMGANNFVKGIAGCLDENGDGTLNITSDAIALYYTSLSSQPSATVDNLNNLYLAYSAVSESNISSNSTPQNYRHIILTKSKDSGATWPEFVDVINDSLIKDDPTFYTFVEAVFPSIIINGNDLHLTFMLDYEPGLTVAGDLDPSSENEMAHLIFDKNTLTLTEKVNKPAFFAMTLTPNIVNESTRVNFEVAKGGKAQLEVYSLTGQLMQTKSLGQIGAGVYNEEINLQHLTSGNYIIKLKVGVNSAAVKLVKI